MQIAKKKTAYFLGLLGLFTLLLSGCSQAPGGVEPVYTLKVEVVEPGSGEVIIEPEKDFYSPGEKVTLTARAADGWAFDHWGDNLDDFQETITIIMDGNKYILAHFLEEKPLGEEVKIDKARIHFEGGVSLDLSELALPEGTTVTVEEVSNPPLPQEVNLDVAGKVMNFDFSMPLAGPVGLVLPLIKGVDPAEAAIFYLKDDGNWEYQETEIVNGKLMATVNHFSTYGVLKGEQVGTPKASIPSGTVNKGLEVILMTTTEGASIYYTLDGSEADRDDILYQEPIIINQDTVIKARAYQDNMLASELAIYQYTIDDSADTAGLNVALELPANSNIVSGKAFLLTLEEMLLDAKELLIEDGVARAAFVNLDANVYSEVLLGVELYDKQGNLLTDGYTTIKLTPGETTNALVEIFNGTLEITIDYHGYPLPPTELVAVQREEGIELSWRPPDSEDIAGYSVFRSYSQDGIKTQLNQALVTADYFVDTGQLAPNTNYWYWVISYDEEGYASDFSEPVSVMVK